ncbi:MAG: DUF4401 domain-containing protein [Shewanella sp.]
MSPNNESLWRELQQATLVVGEAPVPSISSPWYVKLLMALSGWLAAILVLIFLAVSFDVIFQEPPISALIGVGMIAAAYGFFRTQVSEFMEHIALAVSFAGQMLIGWVIFELTIEANAWLLLAAMQLLLALVIPNTLHRFLCALCFTLCACAGTLLVGIVGIIPSLLMALAAWLWVNEFSYPKWLSDINALGYGLLLGLVITACVNWYGDVSYWFNDPNIFRIIPPPWLDAVLTGLVLCYVANHIVSRLGFPLVSLLSLWMYVLIALVCAATMYAPGISLAVLILLLGFYGSNRQLLGLGIASLLCYVSYYYYQLDTSLLLKAQSLLLLGVVLLAARWALVRGAKTQQGVIHE